MLVCELLPLVKDVARVVDVAPGTADLRRHLMVPAEVPYTAADPADVSGAVFTPDTLLVCLVGPQEGTHTPPAGLSPALRALPAGAKALILVGWPPEDFPYQLLLGPLADGGCQVTDVAPVEPSGTQGVYLALIAERVDELLPRSA